MISGRRWTVAGLLLVAGAVAAAVPVLGHVKNAPLLVTAAAAVLGTIGVVVTAPLQELLGGWAGRDQRLVLAKHVVGAASRGRPPRVNERRDPLGLGVSPPRSLGHEGRGIVLGAAAGGELTPYVGREIDADLDAAVDRGGLVVLRGPSKSGKSRAAYEAMQRRCGRRDLIEPTGPGSLTALADSRVKLKNAVIWLDDLETYRDDLTPYVMQALLGNQSLPHNVTVLATVRTQEIQGNSLPSAAMSVLAAATQITVPGGALKGGERLRAQGKRDDPRIDEALRQESGAGFAEYLAAAPELLERWLNAREDYDDLEGLAGAALVSAAIDARLGGHVDPLPRELLEELLLHYLGGRVPRERLPDLVAAFAWATRPIFQASSCLLETRSGEYVPFDYLVDYVQRTRESATPDHVWDVLLSHLTPDNFARIGESAARENRLDIARRIVHSGPNGRIRREPGTSRILMYLAEAGYGNAVPGSAEMKGVIAAGLAALRASAVESWLSSAVSSPSAAQAASADAARVARWCLADGSPEEAVQALELGRAQSLNAVIASAEVPALLAACQRLELTDEWRSSHAHALGEASGTDDLRSRVLAALDASPSGSDFLSPVTPATIARAAHATGTDAVAYLLPGTANDPGHALVIYADTTIGCIELPLLADLGPVDEFLNADTDPLLRHPGLGDLCDWAWEAASGPLLRHVTAQASGLEPRLVVIPCGPLAAVPWHLARARAADGQPEYACMRAVWSYAASGHQFTAAARRPRPDPRANPAVIGNAPGGLDLPGAALEAEAIYQEFYSSGSYLGSSRHVAVKGPGSRTEVLRLLSDGVSMLHFAGHAHPHSSPLGSALLLAGGEQLSVQEILDAMPGMAASRGALIVLAALQTDWGPWEYENTLTLASAFVTAGAAGAVGIRWPVSDRGTAMMMFMFHHYLNNGFSAPAEALRAAQLWMIDHDRMIPQEMPDDLARYGRRRLTFQEWGAFVYTGQ